MPTPDVIDYYFGTDGKLHKWLRGASGTSTVPGAPTSPRASLAGTTATITWAAPLDDGGSPVTGYQVALSGGATQTLGVVLSTTFTGLTAGGTYTFTIAAVNDVGAGVGAIVTVSVSPATASRFPGDVRGNLMLFGIDELDKDPTTINSPEVAAPEMLTGTAGNRLRAAGIRYYYKGTWSAIMGTSGTWAANIASQYAKGRIVFGSMNVMSAGDNWATAADGTNNAVFDNWIAWCEETAPDVPIPMSFNHEPNFTTTAGSTAQDFGRFARYVRSRMDVYAAAHGGVGVYAWKHLSFGPIYTAQDYAKTTGTPGPVQPSWDAAAKVTATVAASTDTFTSTGHLLSNGRQVTFLAPPTGITTTTTYYVISATANTFKVSATLGGSAVNVTADATGVTVVSRDVYDWMAGDPYVSRGGTITPAFTTNMTAMLAWVEDPAHTYPLAFTEFAIYNRDPTAATKLQQVYDTLLDGTHDIWAVLYYNSGDQSYTSGNALFTEFILDNVSNGNLLDKYVALLKDTRSVRFWDLARPDGNRYAKPAGATF